MNEAKDQKIEKSEEPLLGPSALPKFHILAFTLTLVSVALVLFGLVSLGIEYVLRILEVPSTSTAQETLDSEYLTSALIASGIILFIPSAGMFTFSKESVNDKYFEKINGVISPYDFSQILWCIILLAFLFHKSAQKVDTGSSWWSVPFLTFPPYFWIVLLVSLVSVVCFVFLNHCIKQMRLYEENKT